MNFIRGLFRYHKLKILGAVGFALLFAFLIFPYDDLADLATAKVSEATGNSVYLQFDSLNLNAVPVGIGLEQVAVETATLPTIKASSLTVSPWLSGLLLGKQGAAVDATGIFGGAVAADYRDGDKTAAGDRFKSIAVDASGLKLPELMAYLRDGGIFSLLLQGTLDLNTALVVDPGFGTQPTGDVGFNIKGFTLPSQTLAVSMMPGGPAMPLPVPELKLGNTKMAAKMSEGALQISEFTFGGDPKGLSGKVTGQLGLTFRGGPGGVQPVVGAYDLRINLKMPKEFVQANERAGLSLAFAMLPPAARKDSPEGTQLAFRIQPPAPGQGVPQITAIQ
jgi:type II secretion system protein N